MEKVLTFPRPEGEGLSDVGSATLNRADRTFMCTVLFIDIVEYAKKPVSVQLRVKEHFNARLSEALRDIAVNDRIILDTGDGAAINFLGDPEDALFVAMSLAQAFSGPPAEGAPTVHVRIGINLGPVRLVTDINGQPNIIGDGINVAERVMSFAGSGQVLVSRAYYEVVTRIAEDYAQLFAYQGSRTDKHVREHEIYAVASSGSEARDVTARRQRTRPALVVVETKSSSEPGPRAWTERIKLPYVAAAISALALMCAIAYFALDQASTEPSAAAKVAPAIRLAEPASPAVLPPGAPEARLSPASEPKLAAEKPPVAPKKAVAAHKPSPADAQAAGTVPVAAKVAATEPGQPVAAPVSRPAPAATVPDAPAASAHTAPAAKGATALVQLAVSPWGEVVVDGKAVGVSPPLAELELAPGAHRVEIRNGDFSPHLVTLQLDANQTVKIKHKFTQR